MQAAPRSSPASSAGTEAPLRFFAICPRGLEDLLAAELKDVGAVKVKADHGGVEFRGSLPVAYAANLHSRVASRVLWQVARSPYAREEDLYAAAKAVAWESHFGAQQTLRLDINASRSPLRSLEFALLRVKDGIVDRLRDRTGARPDIDRDRPDVRVFVYLDPTHVSLYLDLSGEPLFKRGWRADKGEAPLKENLAAGLLMLCGWSPAQPLLDPFCGSGTLVIEAACWAVRRAPGIARRFAFERLRGFDAGAWRTLTEAARDGEDLALPLRLTGRDISTRVVEQARKNAELAGLRPLLEDGRLTFEAADARAGMPPARREDETGIILTNPPYGEQSNPKSATVPGMMGKVGDHLKQHYTGWQAFVLTSDRGLPRQMRLQETRKTVLYNGALECRLFRFDLVSGRYRPRSQAADAGD